MEGFFSSPDLAQSLLPFLSPLSYMAIRRAFPLMYVSPRFPSARKFFIHALKRRFRLRFPLVTNATIEIVMDKLIYGGYVGLRGDFLLSCLVGCEPLNEKIVFVVYGDRDQFLYDLQMNNNSEYVTFTERHYITQEQLLPSQSMVVYVTENDHYGWLFYHGKLYAKGNYYSSFIK